MTAPNGDATITSYAGDMKNGAVEITSWGGAYVQLPPGVTTLMVTWDGNNALTINLSEAMANASRIPQGTIQAGQRTKIVQGIGVKTEETRYLSLTGASTGRATVVMITFPLTT